MAIKTDSDYVAEIRMLEQYAKDNKLNEPKSDADLAYLKTRKIFDEVMSGHEVFGHEVAEVGRSLRGCVG
jgi:ribonuclease HI